MKKILSFVLFNLLISAVYAADGDLDLSFGTSGFVSESSPMISHYSAVVQPDGKILAAGQSFAANFTTDYSIVRYNPNGSLDSSFGTNGKVFADLNNRSDILPTLVLQPDGRIILVGISKNTQDRNIVALLRFNPNGTPDTTFGSGGRTFSAFTTSGTRGDTPSDAVLQPDGKIVVSGSWSGTAFCVARWNADGSLDTNFGTNGNRCMEAMPVGTGTTNSIALQNDGKILMSGGFTTSFTNPFDFIVYRFNSNGTPDTTFDGDGWAITDLNGGNDTAHTVIVKPDGKILAVGSARAVNAPDTGFGLVQYNANGTLDATFGAGGKALTTFAGGEGFVEDFPAVLLANGKIVVARTRRRESPNIGNESQIARFNPNGSLDTSFGSGGQIVSVPLFQTRDLALQPDGKIIAVGANQNNSPITARFLNTDAAAPVNNSALRLADFDGDGKTDASVFRNGTWFVRPSAGGTNLDDSPQTDYAVQFGLPSDKLTPADFDGDGKTDIAVWREAELARFYILNSSNNTFRAEQFGTTGDNPIVVGDWDGDGKADPTVYRNGASGGQSFFFFRPSAQAGVNFISIQWGTNSDKPMRGDFDGDTKMDAAVFRPSNNTWYILNSSNSQPRYENWGTASDKFVSGDFDGDGKTDLTVFRNGTWYVKQSSNNQPLYINWGAANDTPVAGDYDGDGKTDFAVFRSGVYFILNAASSQSSVQFFGAENDKPAASAFVQ